MISPKKNKNNQPKLTPKFESDHLYLKQSKKRFYMKLTKILKFIGNYYHIRGIGLAL